MAVNKRCEIAQKEIDAYLNVYDKMKKILVELSNDDIKLDKYEKNLRDISVKLIYLKAQKSYIVSFLDNERWLQ